MTTIGIVTAMAIEFEEIALLLQSRRPIESIFSNATKGMLNENTVILAHAGVGKVCTAMAAQWLIDTYHPDVILNVGIAGSISDNVPVGSIVIGTQFVQHDFMPAPWLGRAQGEVPFMGERSFPRSSSQVNDEIVATVKSDFPNEHLLNGTILSGDEPIFNETRKNDLVTNFISFSPLAVDMESAAFAFVATENGVPFSVIRAIADRAVKDDQPATPGANAQANGTAKLVAQVTASFCKAK
jgi:adenosylhomocysteine nucleosidase